MDDKSKNPIVFLDIAVDDEKVGRVVIELFKNKVPKTAENFRALCTGEKGIGKNGKALHYKGSIFHKILSQLMVQGGDIINFDGSGGESIYGPHFEDENLKTLHSKEGLLSMVNEGKPNTNSSQFVITMASCPQLNTTNVVFGKVLKGMGIIKDLNLIPTSDDKPLQKISVYDCGELTNCDNWGLEDNDDEDVYCPYPEDWNPDLDELGYRNVIENIKTVGNNYFTKKRYSIAEKKYNKALRYYDWMIEKGNVSKDNPKINELKILLLLNLAAAKLCQSKNQETVSLCNQVLAMDSKNSKALFRRGQAYIGLNEYELGLADLEKAFEESSKDRDEINKHIQAVKKKIKSYLSLEIEACKRMFKCT